MKINIDTDEFKEKATQLFLQLEDLFSEKIKNITTEENDCLFDNLLESLINTLKNLPSSREINALGVEEKKKFFAAIDNIYTLANDLMGKLYDLRKQ